MKSIEKEDTKIDGIDTRELHHLIEKGKPGTYCGIPDSELNKSLPKCFEVPRSVANTYAFCPACGTAICERCRK